MTVLDGAREQCRFGRRGSPDVDVLGPDPGDVRVDSADAHSQFERNFLFGICPKPGKQDFDFAGAQARCTGVHAASPDVNHARWGHSRRLDKLHDKDTFRLRFQGRKCLHRRNFAEGLRAGRNAT